MKKHREKRERIYLLNITEAEISNDQEKYHRTEKKKIKTGSLKGIHR